MKEDYMNLPWHKRESILHAFPLTDEEKLELAREMAEAKCEMNRLEFQLGEIKKEYREKIDMQSGILAKAASQFKSGLAEPLELLCDVYQDFENGEMVYVSVSENREIKRRPMLENEKRPNLFAMLGEEGTKIRSFSKKQ